MALTEGVKENTIIYIDDCLCYSTNVCTHLENIEALLENLLAANLTINLEKSQFFRKEIAYLGYQLTTNGIRASEEKVAAIRKFPTPKNQKQLKGFLGLTNFYKDVYKRQELRSHINHIKSGQERLQRRIAETEIGPSTSCLLYTSVLLEQCLT